MVSRLLPASLFSLTLVFSPLCGAQSSEGLSGPADETLLRNAGNLIAEKQYGEALSVLNSLSESPEGARLRLLALRFRFDTEEFFRYAAVVFDRYPRETGPARVFLDYLNAERKAGHAADPRGRPLLDLILKRLPALIPADADLAWMAAPFISDIEEARRLVMAYRAVNGPAPASLPVALNLGVIDEETAMADLFGIRGVRIDKDLIEEIWSLFRDNNRRSMFSRNLSAWPGVITEDVNGDGIAEGEAVYRGGLLTAYTWDANQDKQPELAVYFEAGFPRSAVLRAVSAGQDRIIVEWENFPAVFEARLGEERFIPRPMDFSFAPVKFRDIAGSDLLFPQWDPLAGSLNRRTLAANSVEIERPSREFSGAVEIVELGRSIPIRAREYLDGVLVSETDFLRGKPLIQRIDLDLDGRLETVRYFIRPPAPAFGAEFDDPAVFLDYALDIDYADSDWDGDGSYESREYAPKIRGSEND
jgi:hypothetical protein